MIEKTGIPTARTQKAMARKEANEVMEKLQGDSGRTMEDVLGEITAMHVQP